MGKYNVASGRGEYYLDDDVEEALSLLHDRTSSEQRATKDYTFVQASQRI